MGLDIRIITGRRVTDEAKIKRIMEHPDGPQEGAWMENCRTPWINPHFGNRADDVKDIVLEVEHTWSFRAGSYSGYNEWRRKLAALVGIEDVREFWTRTEGLEQAGKEPTGPFWQLIHFSDCEGAIGPTVAKKLVKDFEKFEDEAKKQGIYFMENYRDFKKAFEEVAEAEYGWVDFS